MDVPTDCVLPSAVFSANITGLLSTKYRAEKYSELDAGHAKYEVFKKVLPNRFARLDVLLIDGKPAGSVFSIQIFDSLYHMVGMFVKESYRGQRYPHKNRDDKKSISPANFMIEAFKNDFIKTGASITLEVMNYNAAAIKLYEKPTTMSPNNRFDMLSQDQVKRYAYIRGKNIKRWHDISHPSGRQGVQWAQVKEHGNTTTWSISRLYLLSSTSFSFPSSPCLLAKGKINNRAKFIFTVLRYGHLNKLFTKLWQKLYT